MFDIRWLSRLQAVKAVVLSYEALVLYFDNEAVKDVTAEGLARQLKSYQFVVSLHFLYDLLSTLGQLNKLFQIATFHPSAIHGKVNEVIKALKNRYLQSPIRWGPFAKKCIEQIENGEMVVDQGGVGRATTANVKKSTSDGASKLAKAVVDNLLARFPSNELIEASKIFDPQLVPTSEATYGEQELTMLTTHYSKFR